MKKRYFLIIGLLAVLVGMQQLVAHRGHASDLAKTIKTKDASALDVSAESTILQAYVDKHMGSTQKLVFEGSYKRAMDSYQATSSPQSNGKVYAEAQAACAGRTDSITQARCVQAYVASHSTPSSNPQPMAKPKKSDYTKVYKAPGWTGDSTGIALLVALVSVVMTISLLFKKS